MPCDASEPTSKPGRPQKKLSIILTVPATFDRLTGAGYRHEAATPIFKPSLKTPVLRGRWAPRPVSRATASSGQAECAQQRTWLLQRHVGTPGFVRLAHAQVAPRGNRRRHAGGTAGEDVAMIVTHV